MKGESSGSNDDPGDSPFEKEKDIPGASRRTVRSCQPRGARTSAVPFITSSPFWFL